MAPAVLLIAIFAIYPLFNTIYLSLSKYNMASGAPIVFNGGANYMRTITHPQFINSMIVTLRYTLIGVSLTMVLGFIMALLLSSGGAIIKLLRSVALMPYLICSVAITVAWQLLYNPNFGLFNMLLNTLGISSINWLGDVKVALYALVATDVWQFTPFVMILMLAGFQGISPEYYEAAAVDGATRLQMLFRITIPLMKNVIYTILVMRIIDTFKTFEKPKIMTDGGPMRSTEVINVHVYRTSFVSWDFGMGATGAVIVAIIIAILALIVVKLSRIDRD